MEGVMNSNRNEGGREARPMELKYCEHCGGLWVRERGEQRAYCDKCKTKVEELPAPKKKPGKIKLPVAPRAVVDGYEIESCCWDGLKLEETGGAA
jgi:hypothetical protein